MNETQYNAARLATILEEDDAPASPRICYEPECGNSALDGHDYCPKHLAKEPLDVPGLGEDAEAKAILKAQSLCTRCGMRPLVYGSANDAKCEPCCQAMVKKMAATTKLTPESEKDDNKDALGMPISNHRRMQQVRQRAAAKVGTKPLTPEEVEEIDNIKKSGKLADVIGVDPPTFDDVFAEHAKALNPDPLPAPNDIAIKVTPGEGLDFDPRILYGRLGEIAKSLLPLPLGFTFPCLLARAAAIPGVKDQDGWIRPNHYVALLGPVGWGKTGCMDMAKRAIFLPEDAYTITTPSSDRGLIKMLQREGKPFLLIEDEFTAVLNKCAIQNSALPSLINKLWNNTKAGASDKKGNEDADAVFSILGNVKCESPAEFATLFGVKTVSGMSDRFVFGWSKDYIDFQPKYIPTTIIEPKPVRVPAWVWEAKSAWAAGDPTKRRMTEIVLRCALVMAAVNGDSEITKECFEAALRFGEWQLRIRDKYRAGLSMNQGAEALAAVYAAIEERGREQARSKKTDPEIKQDERYEYLPAKVPVDKKDLHLLVNVREACNTGNLYRKYGKLVKEARTLLEDQGFVVRVGIEDRKKPTPFVRLQRKMQ
jgi:hypothetical protein